ncbi:MAG: hypothetical protein VYB05_15790, partial [Pseudomonadota bacterium]|nr:hypothetical protein [Pseudomonadota bacterium]
TARGQRLSPRLGVDGAGRGLWGTRHLGRRSAHALPNFHPWRAPLILTFSPQAGRRAMAAGVVHQGRFHCPTDQEFPWTPA